jgi:hypothetical protein
MSQARADFGRSYAVVDRSVPGTAPCDWVPELSSDLASYQPSVVVVATAGYTGAPSQCETAAQDSSQMLADYQRDLATFAQDVTATSAQLVFVEDPPFLDPGRYASGVQIDADEVSLAYASPHVSVYTSARKAMSTATNDYVAYAKCSKETVAQGCDPSTHLVAIRTVTGPDVGVNLCPDGVIAPSGCDEYSSGEVRFGKYLETAAERPNALYGTSPATPRFLDGRSSSVSCAPGHDERRQGTDRPSTV